MSNKPSKFQLEHAALISNKVMQDHGDGESIGEIVETLSSSLGFAIAIHGGGSEEHMNLVWDAVKSYVEDAMKAKKDAGRITRTMIMLRQKSLNEDKSVN